MPHGQSWFSFIPGLMPNLEALGRFLGWPVNAEGTTWVAHSSIGMQYVVGSLLVAALISVVALRARTMVSDTAAAVVPESSLTIRTFVELFVSSVYGMMSDIMGPKAARFFLPLIGTCAFFIFFSNFLGLVPGFLPPTSVLNTTLPCALMIFITTHVFGVKEHGLAYFAHFFGPIRKWYALPLMLLMFVIEMISHIARPASLSIRLMANMFADHLVVSVFLGLAPWFVPIPMMLLGVLVCVVQTLVFCILSCVYISMAIAHEEH